MAWVNPILAISVASLPFQWLFAQKDHLVLAETSYLRTDKCRKHRVLVSSNDHI